MSLDMYPSYEREKSANIIRVTDLIYLPYKEYRGLGLAASVEGSTIKYGRAMLSHKHSHKHSRITEVS